MNKTTTEHDDVRTIHVYKNDSAWDKVDRWFMVPQATLDRLYVASYEIRNPEFVSEADMEKFAGQLRKEHGEDCVLVY
jgi:hypothetical protein